MSELEPEPDGEPTRPAVPLSVKLIALAVVLVAAWLVVSLAFATLRAVFAFAGYIIVAVLAFFVGRSVGRHSRT